MGGTGSPFCKEDTDRCSDELVLSECWIPKTGSVMSLGGWGQWCTKGASWKPPDHSQRGGVLTPSTSALLSLALSYVQISGALSGIVWRGQGRTLQGRP